MTEGVEEALEVLRPGLRGVEIDSTIFRPATFIETAIDNLTRALLIGCLLVVVILGLFLFEWRTAVISLVAIPLSLVAAGLVLTFRGETINTMVLAGLVIAVGVVVDDAIIDIENIWRRLREARAAGSEQSTASIILEASLEVRSPIVYATLIIVVAVVPILFMEGLSGAFFQPLALSYALAVLVSMVVALTVTPAMSLMLLRSARSSAASRRSCGLVRGYGALLSKRAPRAAARVRGGGRGAVLGLAVLPFLGSVPPARLQGARLPDALADEAGTSLPEETRISKLACRELRQVPGVRNCGSHIGQALLADEVVGVDFGENWISVDPEADYDATLAGVQEVVDGYPGPLPRRPHLPAGAGQRGADRDERDDRRADLRRGSRRPAETAEEVKLHSRTSTGLIDLHVELAEDIPHIAGRGRSEAAGRYGLKPGESAARLRPSCRASR